MERSRGYSRIVWKRKWKLLLYRGYMGDILHSYFFISPMLELGFGMLKVPTSSRSQDVQCARVPTGFRPNTELGYLATVLKTTLPPST